MARRSPLDDPRIAAHAWHRFRRLMLLMLLITVGAVIIALALVYNGMGMVSAHLFIATAVGVGGSMLLMSALMGLVFLSSGTGHDEAIEDRLAARDQGAGDEDGRRR
jgi:Ca2+/Na+ antiporter